MFERIENTSRAYAWGRRGAISALLGAEPSDGLEAELWFGSHHGSPSRLASSTRTLADTAPGLPFLLKLLAAGAPLSLQAHPAASHANEGFERENAAGVPVDSAERNYRDPNPKPELVVALSDDFEALAGFRPVADIRQDLARIASELGERAVFDPIDARLTTDATVGETFLWVCAGSEPVRRIIEFLERWLAGSPDGFEYLTTIAKRHPGDPGIAGSLLLHHVVLAPGEALYLAPGNIHAYLDGLAVELMAPSDNVLRGGLTVKHVDVAELGRVLDRAAGPVPSLQPTPLAAGGVLYAPDDPDVAFSLAFVDAAASIPLAGPAIAVCTEGAFTVAGALGAIDLARGDAVFVTADESRLDISGAGSLYLAR